jgi:hypothetical protein
MDFIELVSINPAYLSNFMKFLLKNRGFCSIWTNPIKLR